MFTAIRFEINEEFAIACDNQQTIRLITTETPKLHTKLKHVDIKHHWLREMHDEGKFVITFVRSADNAADGMTKPLPRQKHENFIRLLGMQNVTTSGDDEFNTMEGITAS